MKKIIGLSIVIFLSIAACRKQSNPQDSVQTVNVSLAANTSYTYNLGQVPVKDVQIITPSSHASVSKISSTPADPAVIYEYTPDSSYTGTEQVRVVLAPHCGEHCKKSQCGGKPGAGHAKSTYIFNFTVGDKAGTATK